MRPSPEQPPDSLSVPQQALWWLYHGHLAMGEDWQKAHALCQQREGDFAHDLVHALCHWIEGDIANRDYWYRRLGSWQRASTIALEYDNIQRKLA